MRGDELGLGQGTGRPQDLHGTRGLDLGTSAKDRTKYLLELGSPSRPLGPDRLRGASLPDHLPTARQDVLLDQLYRGALAGKGGVVSRLGDDRDLARAGEVREELARRAARLAKPHHNDATRADKPRCHGIDDLCHGLGLLDVARGVNQALVLSRKRDDAHLGIGEAGLVAGKLVEPSHRVKRKPGQRALHE